MDEISKAIQGNIQARVSKLDNFRAELTGENIEKGRAPLTGGRWVTLDNGEHVYIKGGKVAAGAGGALSDKKGDKKSSPSASGGKETQEQKNDRITLQQLERNHRNDSDGHVRAIRDQVKKKRDNTSFTNSTERMNLSRKLKGYDALLKNRKEGGKTQDQIKEAKESKGSGDGIKVGETKFLDYNGNENRVVGEMKLKNGKTLYKVEINGKPSANLESAEDIKQMQERQSSIKSEKSEREKINKEKEAKEASEKAKKEAYSKKVAPISSGSMDQGKKEKDLAKFVSINGNRGQLHEVLDKLAQDIKGKDIEFRDIKGKPHFSTDGSTYTPLHNKTGEKYFKHITEAKKKSSSKEKSESKSPLDKDPNQLRMFKSFENELDIIEKGAMTQGNIYAKNPKDEVKKKIDKMFDPETDDNEPDLKKKCILKKSVDIIREEMKISKAIEEEENIHFISKGKKMPIGTVSNGRKKVAEGKWVDEKKGNRGKTDTFESERMYKVNSMWSGFDKEFKKKNLHSKTLKMPNEKVAKTFKDDFKSSRFAEKYNIKENPINKLEISITKKYGNDDSGPKGSVNKESNVPVEKITSKFSYLKDKFSGVSGKVDVHVVPRDTKGMSGSQDKYKMEAWQDGKKVADLGTHPQSTGMKFNSEGKKAMSSKSEKKEVKLSKEDFSNKDFEKMNVLAEGDKKDVEQARKIYESMSKEQKQKYYAVEASQMGQFDEEGNPVTEKTAKESIEYLLYGQFE